MKTAHFKTLRESMGMTLDWVATQLGVSPRSAAEYEAVKLTGDIPPRAEELITKWWDFYKERTQIVLEELRAETMRLGYSPKVVDLSRYMTDTQCANAGNTPMTAKMHAALLAHTLVVLEKAGYVVEIEYVPADIVSPK